MRLGKITGWDDENAKARDERNRQTRARKAAYEKQKRRKELQDAGFVPPRWVDGSDECPLGQHA